MSSGKGHILGGLVFLWLFLHVLSNYFFTPGPLEIFLYAVIVILFALWPDVDIKSLGQKLFYTVFFAASVVLLVLGEYRIGAWMGCLIILPILANHRGWTHTRLAAVLLPVPLLLIPKVSMDGTLLSGMPFYFAGVTGYFSHLFYDRKLL
jgi:membrane-bound metal-dependent hydrolase YbcI (DUF457 family)